MAAKYNENDKVILNDYSYVVISKYYDRHNKEYLYKLSNKDNEIYNEKELKPFIPPHKEGENIFLKNNTKVIIYRVTGFSNGQYNYCYYDDSNILHYFKDKDILTTANVLKTGLKAPDFEPFASKNNKIKLKIQQIQAIIKEIEELL